MRMVTGWGKKSAVRTVPDAISHVFRFPISNADALREALRGCNPTALKPQQPNKWGSVQFVFF